MESKPFRLGILVGRFQMLHAGHENIINKAIALCENVGVFVGSSEESGNFENPFSYEMRKELLRIVFGSKINVFPLPDIFVGSYSKWGDYILEKTYERYGTYPDLFITGKEERRTEWFCSEKGKSITELYIPKSFDISASKMRDYLINGMFDEWKKYTNPLIWNKYKEIRKIVISSKNNIESRNI